MSLIVYPTSDYDSFISVLDADSIIANNTLFNSNWTALTTTQKEVYLRIASTRILNVIDTALLDGTDSCLVKVSALMAVRDLVFEISSSINPNTGLVSSEKVGDLQVTYYHGNTNRQVRGKNMNPFPPEVVNCLADYDADIYLGGVGRARMVHS